MAEMGAKPLGAKPLRSKRHRPLACSPLRPSDQVGSVLHDAAFAWAHAESLGMEYIGPIGQRSDLPELDEVIDALQVRRV